MTALSVAARAPGGRRAVGIGPVRVLIHPRTLVVVGLLTMAALTAALAAVGTGTIPISFHEVPSAALGWSEDGRAVRVVQHIRLPRALAALAAGGALGLAGSIFQSLSRNALGSPDVIGFTTGAASGALAQIVLFGGSAQGVALASAIGGLATAALVLLLARSRGAIRGPALVLVGIGIGAILGAINGLLLVKGDLDTAQEANLWLSGSLDARTWPDALPAALALLVLGPAAAILARRAELLELGDDLALQLGVHVERTRLILVAIAVLLTAAATAACGPIAFVALAAPQLVRRLTGSGRLPIAGAIAMGALLLQLADLVTMYLPVTFTVPIGRMTGIVGGSYLIWLLLRKNQVRA